MTADFHNCFTYMMENAKNSTTTIYIIV